ncbi:hypothetical protein HPB50_009395 [Hyalomma asiaticum]|uniref:Uncharacterized protein n=1 Tax=Hyalomma asiaticum TaxID=266040 RepID=A0ACB7TER0_HYAAI|nr:hypothetical protein HPB50_009395 [Hyalomma asiaticum]
MDGWLDVWEVLRAVKLADRAVTIKWFPARMGRDVSARGNANHNEMANEAARGFTYHTAQPADSTEEWPQDYAPPHPGLSRSEAVTYRQLQTGSLPTPVLMKHVCCSVYVSDLCRNPREASTVTTIPPWLMAAAGSDQLEEQTRAVQWSSAALEKQRPSEIARCPIPPQHRGRRGCQKKAGAAKAARREEDIMPR